MWVFATQTKGQPYEQHMVATIPFLAEICIRWQQYKVKDGEKERV